MTNLLKQIYYVAWGDMMFMRHNFLNILIMSIMSPILYLIAFGFGLRTGTTDIGVSYVSFVIPGIVALSSLNSSFSSTSTRMNVQRLYYRSFDEMMMCPLSLHAIVWGKCMLGLVRGLIACFILYALGLGLGAAGIGGMELELTPSDPLASTRNSMVHPEQRSLTLRLMSCLSMDTARWPWGLPL